MLPNKNYLEPEFADHYTAWRKSPNPETSGQLLKTVQPVITEAIRSYGGGSAASPTLVGKAKQLTLSALQNYDPNRSKIRTHLLTQLQSLRRVATKELQAVHIPEQLLLDLGHLHGGEATLRDTLGREPSDAELADHTGLSLKRISYARGLRPSYAEGSQIRHDEEGTHVTAPGVISPMKAATQEAWLKFVHADLDPISQSILEHTAGLHGRPILSNQELAAKLRLSPGAVSQRKAKIQEKIEMAPSAGIY